MFTRKYDAYGAGAFTNKLMIGTKNSTHTRGGQKVRRSHMIEESWEDVTIRVFQSKHPLSHCTWSNGWVVPRCPLSRSHLGGCRTTN